MEQFPVNETDLTEEIKKLINEKGLEVVTSKIIRNHLETKFNCDFEKHKSHLDNLIEECIGNYLKEIVKNEGKKEEEGNDKIEKKNIQEKTVKQEEDPQLSSSEFSDVDNVERSSKIVQDSSQTKKGNKRKISSNEPSTSKTSLNEENDDMVSSIKRRRSAAPLPKRTSKQKEKKKEKGSSTKRQTQFTKICALSPELSDLLGKSYMRRSEVVKGVWTYLKSNNLQDPKKKQFYFLDDPLKRIFGSSKTKFKAFGMMGILNKHVKDVEFLDVESRRIAEAEIAKIIDEENKTNKSAIHSDTGEEDDEGEEGEEEEMEGGNDGGGNKLSNKCDDVSDEKKIGVKASSKASSSSEGEEEEEE
uniref:Uncharacterized protein n=1 Tax=Meloidogyne enterolobii TaxID=390850 RepID=A0A6V7X7B8_MELEN|nr:unnamed protein product [Meloidogyne enterolobii]